MYTISKRNLQKVRKIQVGNENTYIVEKNGKSTLRLTGEWITKNE